MSNESPRLETASYVVREYISTLQEFLVWNRGGAYAKDALLPFLKLTLDAQNVLSD